MTPFDPLIAFYVCFAVVFFVLMIAYPIGWLTRRRFRIWRTRRHVRRTIQEYQASDERRRQRHAQERELMGESLIERMRVSFDGNDKPLRMVPRK